MPCIYFFLLFIMIVGVRSDRRQQQPGGGVVLRGRGRAGGGRPALGADGAGDAQGRRHVAHPQIDAPPPTSRQNEG